MSFFKTVNHTFDLAKKTYIMGILNITPDSFSDGGKYVSPENALRRAIEIESQGADILDIGAQSTRPGYEKISASEEWNRLSPVLADICSRVTIPVSIDTFYPEVAEKALKCGVDIINDVSGFAYEEMYEIASRYCCGAIIMHNGSDVDEINSFFHEKLNHAADFGIDAEKICFDPGIGFNKSREQDEYIIRNLKKLKVNDNAILVGVSKKRIIRYLSNSDKMEDRTSGTIAVNSYAQLNGANILRVHDVKEAVNAAVCIDKLMGKEV